jgi:DnaJ like chaperone protein
MGWLGKIVGGTIGFALGGPLGAILGAVFGHTFDTGGEHYYRNDRRSLSYNEQAQLTFFLATFSMLAKLAKADGHISKEEINCIENFMVRDLNLDPEGRRIATKIFHTASDSPATFQDFATQFYNHFRHQPQLLELMMDVLFRVSVADGVLSESEEALILSAARIFNFSEEKYRKIRSRYAEDFTKYYAILGSESSDSDEHIKKQYRKLAKEYHPDKIAAQGLPEEFTKFAHDKFREIQEAYETIRRKRGIQ